MGQFSLGGVLVFVLDANTCEREQVLKFSKPSISFARVNRKRQTCRRHCTWTTRSPCNGNFWRRSRSASFNRLIIRKSDLPRYLGINPEDKHGFIASISIRRCRFRKGLAEQRFIHCTFAIELHLVETCVAQGFDLHFPRHLDLAMFAVDRRFASLDLEDVLTPTGCVRGCDAVFLFVGLKCGAKFAHVPE